MKVKIYKGESIMMVIENSFFGRLVIVRRFFSSYMAKATLKIVLAMLMVGIVIGTTFMSGFTLMLTENIEKLEKASLGVSVAMGVLVIQIFGWMILSWECQKASPRKLVLTGSGVFFLIVFLLFFVTGEFYLNIGRASTIAVLGGHFLERWKIE